jgi:hypothetical protein
MSAGEAAVVADPIGRQHRNWAFAQSLSRTGSSSRFATTSVPP